MKDVFVARLMSTTLHTVTPDALIEGAAQLILDNNISPVTIVNKDNRLEGILTTADFVDIVTKSQPKAQTTVERYMVTDVTTAGAQDSILSVVESMTGHSFHHMPVVDEEEGVIGTVTTSGLVAYLSQAGQLARS